jgi:hypothetical protein
VGPPPVLESVIDWSAAAVPPQDALPKSTLDADSDATGELPEPPPPHAASAAEARRQTNPLR